MEITIGRVNQHNVEILLDGLDELLKILRDCQEESLRMGDVNFTLIVKSEPKIVEGSQHGLF